VAGVLAQTYASNGAEGYWQWRLQELQRTAVAGYVGPSEFAKIYAALGDTDAAVEWLEKAYQEHNGVEMLNVWPGYDSLRSDPRFADLLSRMKFPAAD